MTLIDLNRYALCAALLLGLLQLVSCGHPSRLIADTEEASAAPALAMPWADAFSPFPSVLAVANPAASHPVSARWRHFSIPGKQATHYAYGKVEGRHAIKATSRSAASMLRQSMRVDAKRLKKINFSWKVQGLIPGADLAQRESHDSPVRVVLAFEGDRSRFSAKNAMLSELAHALTGEPLPYATLMYVWCNACTPEAALVNPRTDRIREIAMEAGPRQLGRWIDYERDIRADFEKAFGEPPGALIDVGIMTDADNTRQDAVAWYGPIFLSP
ncbi:MAG: hypothetical protein JWP47_952 [Polaromonas sp.]|nr:hypothetical protein [Polaromonas sp.]